MAFNDKTMLIVYALIAGLLALAAGAIEVLAPAFGLEIPFIPGDLPGGLGLMVIASVYILGVVYSYTRKEDLASFIFVGGLLAVGLGLLYVSMAATGWLGENVIGVLAEEGAAWTAEGLLSGLPGYLRVEMAIAAIALPGFIAVRRKTDVAG